MHRDSGQDLAAFYEQFPVNIAPPTDDTPFFFHTLRLRDIFDGLISRLDEIPRDFAFGDQEEMGLGVRVATPSTKPSMKMLTDGIGRPPKVATVPVWVMPGQPDGVITVHLGYGRRLAGRVGGAETERLLGVSP